MLAASWDEPKLIHIFYYLKGMWIIRKQRMTLKTFTITKVFNYLIAGPVTYSNSLTHILGFCAFSFPPL